MNLKASGPSPSNLALLLNISRQLTCIQMSKKGLVFLARNDMVPVAKISHYHCHSIHCSQRKETQSADGNGDGAHG